MADEFAALLAEAEEALAFITAEATYWRGSAEHYKSNELITRNAEDLERVQRSLERLVSIERRAAQTAPRDAEDE